LGATIEASTPHEIKRGEVNRGTTKMLSFERDGNGRRPSKPQQGEICSRTSYDPLSADLDSEERQRSIDQASSRVLAPEKELHLSSLVESQNRLCSRHSEEDISVKFNWESPHSRKRGSTPSPDSTGNNLGVYFRDENSEWEEDIEIKCLLKEEDQMNSSSSCSNSSTGPEGLKPSAARKAPSILRFGWFSGSSNSANGGSGTDNKDNQDYDEEITGLLNDFHEIQKARHVAFDLDKTDSDDNDRKLWILDSDDDKLSPPPPEATKNTSALDMNVLCSAPLSWEVDCLSLGGNFSSEGLVTSRHSESTKRSSQYSMTQRRFMKRRKNKKQKPNPWDKSFASGRDFQSQLETVEEEHDEERSLRRVPNTTTTSWGEDESKMYLLTTMEQCCYRQKSLRASSKKHGEKKSPVPRLMAWISGGKLSHQSKSSKTDDEGEDASCDECSHKPTEFVQVEEKPSSVSSFETSCESDEVIEVFTAFNVGETSAFAPYGSIAITSAKMLEKMSQRGEISEI
jgi:hypothetical protein